MSRPSQNAGNPIDALQKKQTRPAAGTLQPAPLSTPLKPLKPRFSIIYNDHSRLSLRRLIEAKCLISRQLPKMPRVYITKLLFDTTHQTLFADNEHGQLMGCLTFRTFPQKDFAEVVFLAVEGRFRDRRVGSQIMDKLKQKLQKRGVRALLTYADNTALGFFRKQGFEATVETAACPWYGYIKIYLEGTLMKCEIFEGISYTRHAQVIQTNRANIIAQVKSLPFFRYSSQTLQAALQRNPFTSSFRIEVVPGVLEAMWSTAQQRQLQQQGEFSLTLQQLAAVEALRQLNEASIFRGLKQLPVAVVETEQLETLASIEKKIISGRNFASVADTCRAITVMAKSYEKYLKKGSPEVAKVKEFQKKMVLILNYLMDRQLTIQIDPTFKEKDRNNRKKQPSRPKTIKQKPPQ